MRKLLLAALMALAGCDQGGTGADGYAYGPPEFERHQVTVTLITYSSQAALRAEATRRKIRTGDRDLMAFGYFGKTQPTCTIHIVDPRVVWAPEWLGHEAEHCFSGNWHK